MTMPRRPLVLDLDYTLLHLERLPGSIEVPGRTRSAWIAPGTVELLHQLQSHFDIVIATARSWDGTRWVWDGLAAHGVNVSAVVIEDGALHGQPTALQTVSTGFDREAIRASIEDEKGLPEFEWQHDFKACLVARCADSEKAKVLVDKISGRGDWPAPDLRFARDGRKVYIVSRSANKWSALTALLGEQAMSAAGIGDGENDLPWLKNVADPCTLTGAVPSVVSLVQERKGYLSPHSGHEGIADVLRQLLR